MMARGSPHPSPSRNRNRHIKLHTPAFCGAISTGSPTIISLEDVAVELYASLGYHTLLCHWSVTFRGVAFCITAVGPNFI